MMRALSMKSLVHLAATVLVFRALWTMAADETSADCDANCAGDLGETAFIQVSIEATSAGPIEATPAGPIEATAFTNKYQVTGEREFVKMVSGKVVAKHSELIYSEHARTSSGESTPVTASEQNEFLEAHNLYRCMHGADNVAWSNAMAADAEKWIAPMTYNTTAHSSSYTLSPPEGPAGENLYESSGAIAAATDVVASWYSEVDFCNPSPESFTDGCHYNETGHLTPIVWKGVKEIGCAWSDDRKAAICRYKGDDTLNCNTPNMGGCYVQQVGTRSKTAEECGGSTPAPTPAPTPGAGGSACVTEVEECVFQSSGCGGMVQFSFDCAGPTYTLTMPDNYVWDFTSYCPSCGQVTIV